MCGITGFLTPAGFGREIDPERLVGRMADLIAHRGPDDSGVWVDHSAGVALGHRRLSIVDLSAAGHQPMASASGRYVLVFNGEIYNHLALRRELGDQPWRGHSDTETMLASFERWGVGQTLERLVGMFVFAVWDREDRELYLARDRLGEKPCYYGWQGKTFMFASELKALFPHPEFEGEVASDVVAAYLRYAYVPGPHAIYRGIRKLQPGTFVKLGGSEAAGTMPAPEPYWSLRSVVQAGVADRTELPEERLIDELDRLILQAVSGQLMSDVPLGAFLSGGVDSSLIVAAMQELSSEPVRTFTIGFPQAEFDESKHAEAVAKHLGTVHTTLEVTPELSLAAALRVPAVYDEPFGDSSALPTLLLSELTRDHVTVSLSGDGGDELMAGYAVYARVAKAWERLRRPPGPVRAVAAAALFALPELPPAVVGSGRLSLDLLNLGRRAKVAAAALRNDDVVEFYRNMRSFWFDPRVLMRERAGNEADSVLDRGEEQLGCGSLRDHMTYLDAAMYLPDDILVKVDRAAMSVGLETRVPLLDHGIVEFAFSLPESVKLRSSSTKWLLKQVLYRRVPQELIERPKKGFSAPVGDWLRGPLREWGEELLAESRLEREGFLNPRLVHKLWRQHVDGVTDRDVLLWPILMFQAWLAAQASQRAVATAGGADVTAPLAAH